LTATSDDQINNRMTVKYHPTSTHGYILPS